MGDGNEDVDIHDHPLAVASNEVNYYLSVFAHRKRFVQQKRTAMKRASDLWTSPDLTWVKKLWVNCCASCLSSSFPHDGKQKVNHSTVPDRPW